MGADALGSLRLHIIGHADSVGSDETNNLQSLRRALAARLVLRGISGFSARIPVTTSGRGKAEPWACGPPDGTEETDDPEDCAPRLQLLRTTQEPGEVRVRNDRRVELRVDSPLFAGPDFELLRSAITGPDGTPARTDSVDLQHHLGILRHYPAGIAPLHPVVVRIGTRSNAVRQACSLPANDSDRGRIWLDTGWQKIAFTPEGEPEVSWRLDPGLVVSGVNETALGNRLLIRVRARPDVQQWSESTAPPGQIELMLATQIVQEGQNGRPDAAVGVPDPWRVRVRLPDFLHLLLSGGSPLTSSDRELLLSCLGLDQAVIDDPDRREPVVSALVAQVLAALPRDAIGLMTAAHDYHEPTGMFGLRPGLHLRLLTGSDHLGPRLEPGTGRQDFVDLTSAIELPLYGAPTRRAVVQDRDRVNVSSGPMGHHSVTLDPGLALRWGASAEMSQLSQRASDGTYPCNLTTRNRARALARGPGD